MRPEKKLIVEELSQQVGKSPFLLVTDYTKMPTYFPSYLLGMLEIVRIREKFRAKLGARFTIKEFHERLLKCGNVHPALIEETLDRTWR